MGKTIEESIVIQKVDRDTQLQNELLDFVNGFSWDEVKEHVSSLINDWVFEDWETPFVATIDDKVVGMATIMKSDYYPLPDIFPWVSTIFVSEDYRGHRISEKLIEFANQYAFKLGFDKTYIPSEHKGLYEKYGYRYVKDIVNYGDGIDRLYEKDLDYLKQKL
jgi:GNAT superfamily N-acetyltransferase